MAIHRFENPSTMPSTRGYTHVVESTSPCRTIYLSGQLGMTADGKFAGAPGDFRAQARVAYCQPKSEGFVIGLEFLEPSGRWVVNTPVISGKPLQG